MTEHRRDSFTAFLVAKGRKDGIVSLDSDYGLGTDDVIEACADLTAKQADACLRAAKKILRTDLRAALYAPTPGDGVVLTREEAERAASFVDDVETFTICTCNEGYTSRGRHEPNAVCYSHDDAVWFAALLRGKVKP